ncbi:MAG: rhodanese-like domain-containing protein [Desulfarculaceae bacterium]|jgi:rhodanese-related sulfurtransferase/rubrerythrin
MKLKEAGRITWKTMFGKVPEMSPSDLGKYQAEHEAGSYTLLDVRQPSEYEQEHIPGAQLVPLPQLPQRIKEVDQDKPVVTYCAIGGRSRAAAEMLLGRGYGEVYSVKGGIKAWQGEPAHGPETSGLAVLKGDESPAGMLAAAYGLERVLGGFYQSLAQEASDPRAAGLFQKLAGYETKHENKILQLFKESQPTHQEEQALKKAEESGIMEGGFDRQRLLAEYPASEMKPEAILDLAMMIEAQALDLYMRMAAKSPQAKTKEALHSLADDERAHLASLGDLLESLDSA